MKFLTSAAALAVAMAFATPSFATPDKTGDTSEQSSKIMEHGDSKSMKDGTKDKSQGASDSSSQSGAKTAAGSESGTVSDIPRNQPQCKEAGGNWDDQANVCNDAQKM